MHEGMAMPDRKLEFSNQLAEYEIEYFDAAFQRFMETRDSLNKLKNMVQMNIFAIHIQSERCSQSVKGISEGTPNVKVTKFNLPTLSGRSNEWLSFKQIFTILNHPSLSNIRKLQYVQSVVSADVVRLIKDFPIRDENYIQAWETLKNRYGNKGELVHSLCTKLSILKSKKSDSAKVLHEILGRSNAIICNLQTPGLKFDKPTEVIILHFLPKRLERWKIRISRRREDYSH